MQEPLKSKTTDETKGQSTGPRSNGKNSTGQRARRHCEGGEEEPEVTVAQKVGGSNPTPSVSAVVSLGKTIDPQCLVRT